MGAYDRLAIIFYNILINLLRLFFKYSHSSFLQWENRGHKQLNFLMENKKGTGWALKLRI